MNNDLFSNIKIHKVNNPKGNLLAYGSVLVAGVVQIKFSVMNGQNGPFASFPAQKSNKTDENGKVIYYPDVSIKDKEVWNQWQQLAVKAYNEAGNSGTGTSEQSGDGVPF